MGDIVSPFSSKAFGPYAMSSLTILSTFSRQKEVSLGKDLLLMKTLIYPWLLKPGKRVANEEMPRANTNLVQGIFLFRGFFQIGDDVQCGVT